MAIELLSLPEFLSLTRTQIVLDVRSPGEYAHAHLPGACTLPLFTDAERSVVGTAYKQQSRETAIKLGLDFFGPKMRSIVEDVEQRTAALAKRRGLLAPADPRQVLVHCWRGGMRSGAVAWLLDLYGFRVATLEGGYKAFRQWVLAQFSKPYRLHVLGGYTGSGKTPVLQALRKEGHAVVDLEALAHHRGSALGGIGQPPPPSQEMFENLLAVALWTAAGPDGTDPIWLEDESQRIGNLQLPDALWAQLERSPLAFLEIPFEERLTYLTAEYGTLPKERLVNAIIRLQKRLGGLETKTAIAHLVEDNHRESFRILLRYYDKLYLKGLQKRPDTATITSIAAERVETNHLLDRLRPLLPQPSWTP